MTCIRKRVIAETKKFTVASQYIDNKDKPRGIIYLSNN